MKDHNELLPDDYRLLRRIEQVTRKHGAITLSPHTLKQLTMPGQKQAHTARAIQRLEAAGRVTIDNG